MDLKQNPEEKENPCDKQDDQKIQATCHNF